MAIDNLPPSESETRANPTVKPVGDAHVGSQPQGSDVHAVTAGAYQSMYAEGYPTSIPRARVDLNSKPASGDPSYLELPSAFSQGDNNSPTVRLGGSPFQPTGSLNFDAAPPLSFSPRGDSALGLATPSELSFPALQFTNNASFTNKFDSAFFNTDTTSYLNNDGTKLLNSVFDESGDAAKTAQPTAADADASIKTMLDSHEAGQSWTANGTSYYKDKTGDLVARDNDGFHYYGANGMKLDSHGDNATMSIDGKTIQKVGNDYYKEYPNGEKVKITEKDDLKAIVTFEGHVFEQTKGALKTLNADTMREAAQHKGERIVTAADGTAVFQTFDNGDVLGKNSKTHGSVARLANGDMYAVRDDKVYKIAPNGQIGDPLAANDYPPGMAVDSKTGQIQFHGVDLSGNNLHDAANGVSMADQANQVNVQTPKGNVVASSEGGQEKIQTPDHTFDYDCNRNTYQVFNPDNSVDLSYNYQSQVFNSDGVTFSPDGTTVGDYNYSADSNTVSYDGGDLFSNGDDGTGASYSADGSMVQDDVSSANADAGQIGANLAAGNDDAVAALASDEIADIDQALGSPKLSEGQKAHLTNQRAAAMEALAKADAQEAARGRAVELTGAANPELTRRIAAGGDPTGAAILQSRGILPNTQIDFS